MLVMGRAQGTVLRKAQNTGMNVQVGATFTGSSPRSHRYGSHHDNYCQENPAYTDVEPKNWVATKDTSGTT